MIIRVTDASGAYKDYKADNLTFCLQQFIKQEKLIEFTETDTMKILREANYILGKFIRNNYNPVGYKNFDLRIIYDNEKGKTLKTTLKDIAFQVEHLVEPNGYVMFFSALELNPKEHMITIEKTKNYTMFTFVSICNGYVRLIPHDGWGDKEYEFFGDAGIMKQLLECARMQQEYIYEMQRNNENPS